MIPLGDLIRARIVALLQRHDVTASALSIRAGRGAAWLGRKLDAARDDARALTLEDIAVVLEQLGEEDAAVLFRPVLLPGDEALLGYCRVRRWRDAVCLAFRDGPRAIVRLEGQGLLARNESDDIFTTPEGLALLANNGATTHG